MYYMHTMVCLIQWYVFCQNLWVGLLGRADKYNRRGPQLQRLLRVNLASNVAAKLSFQNLECTGSHLITAGKDG